MPLATLAGMSDEHGEFRDGQIAALAESGWARCPSVARAVADAGLPAITTEYLAGAFTDRQWAAAARAVRGLRERFGGARFAGEVRYGVLLVPDPARLDTRAAVAPEVRAGQLGAATPDVVDGRLGHGVPAVPPGVRPWSPVATVVGHYGPSLGSHERVAGAPAGEFTVAGTDTRRGMVRQVWGARVLQAGADLPDCEHNERWTFTLFPGEGLTGGMAESGTVLKGRVRFRLGRADRGIGPARVAPAVPIA